MSNNDATHIVSRQKVIYTRGKLSPYNKCHVFAVNLDNLFNHQVTCRSEPRNGPHQLLHTDLPRRVANIVTHIVGITCDGAARSKNHYFFRMHKLNVLLLMKGWLKIQLLFIKTVTKNQIVIFQPVSVLFLCQDRQGVSL